VRVPPVQKKRSFGVRGWLIAAAFIIVVLLLSARGLARIYTDYLWFKEVHFSHTWRALIEAKAFPALLFSAVFFVALYVDLVIADRLAPLARSAGPEDEIIERYRNVVVPYAGRIRLVVAAFFSIVMASGVASEWRDWVLFSNATNFGVKDPQFHRDIGFYVFRLPFLEFVAGWTGPAQVQKGATETSGYARLDVAYVEAARGAGTRTLLRMDLAILWKTLLVMARGEGLRF